MPVPKVFISYRRDDCAGHAGRLCEHLERAFGADHVFRDVEDIAVGDDFVATLHTQVDQCQVLLALIGPRWLTVADAQGRRRLDNAQDWVRREIARGLERGIRVVPVLLQGAKLPDPAELPDELAPLARRQVAELRETQFERDAEALISQLAPSRTLVQRYRVAVIALVVALIGVGAYAVYAHRNAPAVPPTTALQGGPETAMEWLLRHKLPTNSAGLMEAIEDGTDEIVAKYLLAGIDPDAVDPDVGVSALRIAIARGNPKTVSLLLDHDASVEGALATAFAHEQYEIVDLLLAHTLPASEIQTGLEAAISQGRVDFMQRLLDKGADPNGNNGEPLLSAVRNGQGDALRWLLEKGAKPALATREGNWTALHEAATRKSGDDDGSRAQAIVAALLDAGLEPKAISVGSGRLQPTPLLIAIHAGNRAAALRLIAAGSDIETRTLDRDEHTALLLAVTKGQADVVEALLARGADIEARDYAGRSAAMLAAMNQTATTLEAILARKPALEVQDRDGNTALIHAAAAKRPESVKALLAARVAVDTQNKAGNAALHVLALRPYPRDTYPSREILQIAKLLIDAGAARDAKNADGDTALALARRAESIDLIALLEAP